MNSTLKSESNIVWDQTRKSADAGGASAETLTTSAERDTDHWRQAIDEMLRWRSTPEWFEPADRPDEEVLDTAIDYAMDQIGEPGGEPAPSSILPSGAGRIAMEWNHGPYTVILEFVRRGTALYTKFDCGRVTGKYLLARNPASRKLELQD